MLTLVDGEHCQELPGVQGVREVGAVSLEQILCRVNVLPESCVGFLVLRLFRGALLVIARFSFLLLLPNVLIDFV